MRRRRVRRAGAEAESPYPMGACRFCEANARFRFCSRMARMEPTEMQEFSKQMKEAGEESLTSISLAIWILAVLVAMVMVVGHRSHTEALLMQARATDQWNLYEAKKMRQDSLEVVIDQLALQPTVDANAKAAKIAEYKAHIAKWKGDLADAQAQAQGFERGREHAEHQAGRYDMGEALLQISVVLSSITIFTRRRSYFVGGLCLGAVVLVIAASALFVH